MISKEERRENLTFVAVTDIGSNHRVLCMQIKTQLDLSVLMEIS